MSGQFFTQPVSNQSTSASTIDEKIDALSRPRQILLRQFYLPGPPGLVEPRFQGAVEP
jgi:hypothetical protein